MARELEQQLAGLGYRKMVFGRIGQKASILGVADVRAFGLTWADCEELLAKLGFSARIEIVAA